MFEKALLRVLSKHLGHYAEFDEDSLKAGIWKGDIVLRNLKLKQSLFATLGEGGGNGCSMLSGQVATLQIKIPWKNIYKEAASITVSGIYIVAQLAVGCNMHAEAIKERLLERKFEMLEEALAAIGGGKSGDDDESGLMANMAKRVIGNLQFNLEDFHLKIFAGSDLSLGITCHTFKAITTASARSKEALSPKDTDNLLAATMLHKWCEFSSLTIYCDSKAQSFNAQEPFVGMSEGIYRGEVVLMDPKFLLRPMSGAVRISLDKSKNLKAGSPRLDVKAEIAEMNVCVNAGFFKALNRISDVQDMHKIRMEHLDIRPPTGSRGAVWLTYAANCVRRMIRKRRKVMSWFRIQTLSRQRVEYIELLQKLDTITTASSGLQFGEEKQKRLLERGALEKRLLELRNLLPAQLLLAIESERLKAVIAKKKESKESKLFSSGGTDSKSSDTVSKFKNVFSFKKKSESQEAAAEVASAMSEDAKQELIKNMASASDVLTVDSSDQTFLQFELDVNMMTFTLLGSFRSTQEVIKVVMMDVISTTSVRGGVSAISIPPLVQVVSLNELQILYRNPDSKFPHILQRVNPNQYLPMLLLSIEIEALGHSSSLPDLKVDCKLDPVRMVYDPCCIEEVLATISADVDDISSAHRSQMMIFVRQLDDACIKRSSSIESLASLTSDSVITSTMSQLKKAQQLVASFSWCVAIKVTGLALVIPSSCVKDDVSIFCLRLQGFDLQSDPMELIRQNSDVVSGQTNWLNVKLTNFDVDVFSGAPSVFEAQWKKQGGLAHSCSRLMKQISFDVNIVGSRGALYSEIKLKKDLAVWSASVILPRVSICVTPDIINGAIAVVSGISSARANFFDLYKDGCAWADVRHSGNLWVSDGPMSKPTQFHVVLSANELFFFKSERESHPTTVIDLLDCTLHKDAAGTGHDSPTASSSSFCISVRGDGKRQLFTFTARKKDEAAVWFEQVSLYLKHIVTDMETRGTIEDSRPLSPVPGISSGRKMSMSKRRGSGHAWRRPSVDAGAAAAIIQSSSIFRLSFLSQSFCFDFFASSSSASVPLASFVLSGSEIALQLENDCIRGAITVQNTSLWRDILADDALTLSHHALTHSQCILCSGYTLQSANVATSTSARRKFAEKLKSHGSGVAVHMSIHHILRVQATSRSASSQWLQNLTPTLRGLSTSFVFNLGHTVINASPKNILTLVLTVNSLSSFAKQEESATYPTFGAVDSAADFQADQSFNDSLSMQFNERVIQNIQANRTFCGRLAVQSIEVFLFEKCSEVESESLFASASMRGFKLDFCVHPNRMVETNVSLKKIVIYDSRSVGSVSNIDGMEDLWGCRAVRRSIFGTVRNGGHLLKVAVRISPKGPDDTHETDIAVKVADARFVFNATFMAKAVLLLSTLVAETSQQVLRHIPVFAVGDKVITQGLQTSAANGAQGIVEKGMNPSTGRYVVRLLHPPEVVAKFGPNVEVLADNIVMAPAPINEEFTPRTQAAIHPPRFKAESFYRGFRLSALVSGFVVVVPRAVGDDVLLLNSGHATLSSQFVRHPANNSYYLESLLKFRSGCISIGSDPHFDAKERRFRQSRDKEAARVVHEIEGLVSIEHFLNACPPAGVPRTKVDLNFNDLAMDISEPVLTLMLSVFTENISPGLTAWSASTMSTESAASHIAAGAAASPSAPRSNSEISLQIPAISLTMIAQQDYVACPYVRVQLSQIDARMSQTNGVSQFSLISSSLTIDDLLSGLDPDVCYKQVMFPNGSHSGPQLVVKRNAYADGSGDTAISLGGSRLVIVHELIRITVESLSRAIHRLHENSGRLNPYGTLAEMPLVLLEQNCHYVDTSDDEALLSNESSVVGTAKCDAWINLSSQSISEVFAHAQGGPGDGEFHVASFKEKDDEYDDEIPDALDIRELEENVILDENIAFDGSNRLLVLDKHTNCIVIDGQGVHSITFSKSRKSPDIIVQDGVTLVFKRISIYHLDDVNLSNKINCIGSDSSFEFGSEVHFIAIPRERSKNDNDDSWRVNCLLPLIGNEEIVDHFVQDASIVKDPDYQRGSLEATVDGSKVLDEALTTIRALLQKIASEPKAAIVGKHSLKISSREQELILVEDPFNRSSCILCLRVSADYTSLNVGNRSKVVVSAHAASIRFSTADSRNDQSGYFLFPTSFSLQYESSLSGMSSVVVSAGFAEVLCSFSSFAHAISMFQSFKRSILPSIETAQSTIKEFKLHSGDFKKSSSSHILDEAMVSNICVDAGGIMFTVFDDCDLKAQPVVRFSMEGFRVACIPNDLVPSEQRFAISATFSASAFNTRLGHWEQVLDDFELEVDLSLRDQNLRTRSFGCSLRIGNDAQPLVVSITDGAFTGVCDVMGRWSTGFSRLMASPSSGSRQHLVEFQNKQVTSSTVSDEFVLQNATGESIIVSFSDAFAIGTSHKVAGCKRAVQQSSNLDVTDYFLEPCGVVTFRHQNAEGSSSLIHDRYITVAIPTGPNRRISARLHLSLTSVSVLHLQNDSKTAATKGDEVLDIVARISRSQSTSQNQIILTSMFCVRNNIERPIILEFVSAGIGTPFATVAPGFVNSVPIRQAMQYLTAANGLQISMRPVGSEHLSPSLVAWSSGQPISSVVSFSDVGIDCCVSGVVEAVNKIGNVFAPLCAIVSSLYVLHNNLPMPFSFQWGGERKVVQPGSGTVLNGLLSSDNGAIVIQLLRGHDGACIGQPVAVVIVSPVTRVHQAVQYVNFDRQVVCVEVKFRDGSDQARDITVFAPFLLSNLTDISIDARKRKLLQSKATEIAGEIVRVPSSGASDWAILPLKESSGLGKKRLSIREADSALWSDMFTVDAPGSSGTVELTVNQGALILPVGVSIETGKRFLSRSICVQVSPLIRLHSCLDSCLVIRQAYVDVLIGCVQPGCSVPLMWSASSPKGTKRHIQIALASSADGAQWSIPLDVQNTSDFLVCVSSAHGGSRTTLRVAIMNKGSALKIEFHPLKADDFLTNISNETSRSLFIKQLGCDQDSFIELLPQSSIPYVWFDPTCISTGAQKKISVALVPSGQQPFGAYALDKIQVLKTVDLMQQAGLKIYASLTCCAGFNVLHLSEKSFDISLGDNSPKSPKSSADDDTDDQAVDSDAFFKVDISVPATHISIVDAAPRELICAYMKKFALGFSRQRAVNSPDKIVETLSVSVANVQVDNEMPNARHSVLLASSSENEGNDVFELSLIRCLDVTSSVLQCPYVSFVLRNIDVCVDPVIITAVDKLITSMEEAASKSKENLKSAMDRLANSRSDAPENDSSRAYIALLNFYPMKIALTVGPYIPLVGAAADDYDVSAKLRALPCVSESPVRINGLVLKHLNGRVKSIIIEISKHYKRQVSQSVFKYLGTTNVLGDPVGLLSSLGTGLSDAFYEPSKTLFTKPKDFHKSVGKGIKSLIGHSLSSTIGSVTKVTEGITRGMSKLTFDTEYQNQMASREKAQNVGHGLIQGMASMGKGIFDGVTGLVTQPVKGAKEEGAKGFFKGFGKGIIGIATKPVAGVIDMASKTTEGITSQASSLRGKKAAVPYRSARGFFLNGTVLPLHGDFWVMQQTLQRCQLNDLLSEGIIWWSRASSGLVVVSLKLLLVIDASDLVTCIEIAEIKTLKKTAECEVLVFCDSVRHEQVKKQGVFGKIAHSPTQKSSKASAQDSVAITLSNALAADELMSHVLECGAVGGSCVSMVAVGRCGNGQVEVVVVEHEERASAAEKFKSSPVRWTYFGGVPCPETKKIELPPLWSGMKCQPAKATVRARQWARVMTTRRFNLAAGTRVVADEEKK